MSSPDPSVPPSPASADAPASFEDALSELESLVQRMEGPGLSLEQSLHAYRRGADLVRYCRDTLADVRQQVKVLEGDVLQPFEDEDPR